MGTPLSRPQFPDHCLLRPNGWVVLGMVVGVISGDFVLDGEPVHLPQKGAEAPPQFWAHFYCGQMAGCIKMPLGMIVGLSPGDFALDGDPVPLPKRGRSPQFFAHVYCGQFSSVQFIV